MFAAIVAYLTPRRPPSKSRSDAWIDAIRRRRAELYPEPGSEQAPGGLTVSLRRPQ